MKKYKNFTLSEYFNSLSQKTPVPGGGSAAAAVGAMGVSLLLMVNAYSKGRSTSKRVNQQFISIGKKYQRLKDRLTNLIDLDAQAYLIVVKAKKKSKQELHKAKLQSQKVPLEICKLCYKAIELSPLLVEKGNKYLVSDVAVAIELLFASFNSALNLIEDGNG